MSRECAKKLHTDMVVRELSILHGLIEKDPLENVITPLVTFQYLDKGIDCVYSDPVVSAELLRSNINDWKSIISKACDDIEPSMISLVYPAINPVGTKGVVICIESRGMSSMVVLHMTTLDLIQNCIGMNHCEVPSPIAGILGVIH